MDTLDQPDYESSVPAKATRDMKSTSPWMIFVGVLFIIGGLLTLVMSISMFFSLDAYAAVGMKDAMMLTAVYLVVGAILFIAAGYFSISSGSSLSSFARYKNGTILAEYSSKQKVFWILMGTYGIITIVYFIAFIILAQRMVSIMAKQYQ